MSKIWWIVGLVLVGLVLGCTGGDDETTTEWRVPSQAPVSVEKTPGHITQEAVK